MKEIADYNNNLAMYYEKYCNRTDCLSVATEMLDEFRGLSDIKQTGILTFCATGNKIQNNIVIYDAKGKKHSYTHHTVLCVNDKVVDVMHGFKLLSMSEYIARLVLCQPGASAIRIDVQLPCDEWGLSIVNDSLKTHIDGMDIYNKNRGFDSIPKGLCNDRDKIIELIEYMAGFEYEEARLLQQYKLMSPIMFCWGGDKELLTALRKVK